MGRRASAAGTFAAGSGHGGGIVFGTLATPSRGPSATEGRAHRTIEAKKKDWGLPVRSAGSSQGFAHSSDPGASGEGPSGAGSMERNGNDRWHRVCVLF